jgi:hypothetical protein
MNDNLLILCEVLLTIVLPLIILYQRGTWAQSTKTWCLVTIPILWYPFYAPLHELSHAAATYMAGGRVTSIKIIPSFWLGEFARAWITQDGITQTWQQLITTAAPYLLDVASVALGILIVRRDFSRKAFPVGFFFMLLCLRPAFDIVCESIGFASGFRGDVYHIAAIIGSVWTWAFLILASGLSLYSIVIVLNRFAGFPGTPVDQPGSARA